ncbi:MFS transporter [Lunatibacter salilacus]|uniref:MFS transporter n=1 Tax=Lunatibacter salilacus TaxID=2483804 RepID=UPI00131ACDEB|nr:MFS transporter [Lunatibacter salilacus]
MEKHAVKLGLKENWRQFLLLVIVNGFVGGMVGLERSILPQLATEEFGMVAKTAILSFIVVFGVTKAVTNYFAGAFANKLGRKRLLVIGWIFAIPIPLLLMYSPTWEWVILANVFLGINQGLAWSSTVVMKIDLVGEKQRGLAMGLNESVGYMAVAAIAFLTGYIAAEWGIRPYPFYLGIALVVAGLLSSIFLIRDTRHHLAKESIAPSNIPQMRQIFWETTWKNKNLGSVTQAGIINNLNDGMVWGLFPILLASRGFDLKQIGIITAIYPAVWGLGQLITGKMADIFSKKKLLFSGMLLQGIALLLLVWAESMAHFIFLSILLGWGTAIVYPAFLAAVAENTHPQDRAESIGIFRLWRDLGYAIGAVITGILADKIGLEAPIVFITGLTFVSALIIQIRMKN